ncbi:unnamed protein product [marine sediment metagenome]|uniref:Uncharacterized protein n=1 Tax=marine sediment metagenome TaxID=412755 RepID=X1AKE6_9ZZZZ
MSLSVLILSYTLGDEYEPILNDANIIPEDVTRPNRTSSDAIWYNLCLLQIPRHNSISSPPKSQPYILLTNLLNIVISLLMNDELFYSLIDSATKYMPYSEGGDYLQVSYSISTKNSFAKTYNHFQGKS